jgi:hypothetical protein
MQAESVYKDFRECTDAINLIAFNMTCIYVSGFTNFSSAFHFRFNELMARRVLGQLPRSLCLARDLYTDQILLFLLRVFINNSMVVIDKRLCSI